MRDRPNSPRRSAHPRWRAAIGFAALWALLGVPGALHAQSAAPDDGPLSRWTIGPYVGGAVHSPVGHHLGLTPNRDHFFLGVRATTPVSVHGRWFLRFAPELVPILVVTNNPTYVRVQSPDGRGAVTIEGHHAPVLGFAFSPIGLESGIGLSGRWVAYTEGAVGGVWFTRQVPVLHSSGFNFTFQVGGGLQWQRSPRTRVRLGYKFHHLSNARTGDENPGIDANVLLVGVERTLGRATRH